MIRIDEDGVRWFQRDCIGCGTPLPEQPAKAGRLRDYHTECQLVRATWRKLLNNSLVLSRYHTLKRAGAHTAVALFGATGAARFAGTLEALEEEKT